LSHVALHIIFTTIVLSVVTYALPLYAGQLSKGDKARLDSLLRKAFKRGFCFHTFSMEELISAADKKIFRQMTSNRHCLHSFLPKLRHTKALNSLRSRGHNYQLPQLEYDLFKNFILILFLHLN